MVALALILTQSVLTATGGIITLQESQRGLACLPLLPAEAYLIEHYNGGRILVDTTANYMINFGEAGIDLDNVIYVGSDGIWQPALRDPSHYADWVIATPGDDISTAITQEGQSFWDHFVLVQVDSTGREVFYRRDLAPLPSRAVPQTLLQEHQACDNVFHVNPLEGESTLAPTATMPPAPLARSTTVVGRALSSTASYDDRREAEVLATPY
jgi:hypothetical protein